MRTKTLLGSVAILALLGTGAMAQGVTEMPNDGRYTIQLNDAGEPALNAEGQPIVLREDGAEASPDEYRIDDAGEIVILMVEDEATAQAEVTETQGVAEGTAVEGGTGGEFIVEQAEPTVTVDVPDPTVVVNQAQPEVTVEQPTPEITVQVAPPTVNVEQPAPVITVEQQQPVVTVRIPEPIVTIRMPEPEVQVSQDDPTVQVEQPEPVVRFIRPEPEIRVEQAEAVVNIAESEPTIEINRTTAADVTIEQAEAQVSIEETGEAQVNVTDAEPVVQVEQAEAAEVAIEQGEAVIDVQENAAVGEVEVDAAAVAELETQGFIYNAEVEETEEQRTARIDGYSAFADTNTTDLVGRNVLAADGEDVGEVDSLVRMGDRLMAVVGVGGFLGLGEYNVALPLNLMATEGDNLVVQGLNSDQLQNLPQYDEASAEAVTDGRIGDFYE